MKTFSKKLKQMFASAMMAFAIVGGTATLSLIPQEALANGANTMTSNGSGPSIGKVTKGVITKDVIADRDDVKNAGWNKIMDNSSTNYGTLWLTVFSFTTMIGLFSFLYAYLKFREAGKQDQDTQKDALMKKVYTAAIAGVIGFSFSVIIASTTDAFGVSGSQGVQTNYRVGESQLDGAYIGY